MAFDFSKRGWSQWCNEDDKQVIASVLLDPEKSTNAIKACHAPQDLLKFGRRGKPHERCDSILQLFLLCLDAPVVLSFSGAPFCSELFVSNLVHPPSRDLPEF